MIKDNKTRCKFVNLKNETYVKYHDFEWGKPVYDDKKLFEYLFLECFQAGLSFECVLNKREFFSEAFDNFDYIKISKYDLGKVNQLLQNKNIIRNKLKILSIIKNAKVFIDIQNEYDSFSNYIWHWTKNKIIYENNKTKSILSDEISEDLIKRGMKYVGSIIIYSYLQAIGVIYAHEDCCYLFKIK